MGRESEVSGLDLPPVAPLLMQSLRAVGYTLQAALADLIDNSIAAEARNVEIDFDTRGRIGIRVKSGHKISGYIERPPFGDFSRE